MHVTSVANGLKLTNNTSEVLQPVGVLRDLLVRRHGAAAGALAWRRAEESVRRSILQAVFSVPGFRVSGLGFRV